MTIDVYERGGFWFIRIIARNGRIVFDSGRECDDCGARPEGYRRRRAAVETAQKIATEITTISS